MGAVPPIAQLPASPPGDLLDAFRRGAHAVSDKTGIIRRVYFESVYDDDPNFHWAVSDPASLDVIVGRPVANAGIAASAIPQRAAMKAMGESIERYCAAFYDSDDLILARATELPGPAVDLTRFALFDARQYATALKPIRSDDEAAANEPTGKKRFHYAPVNDATPLRWTRARSLTTGDIKFVPAAFVFIPYEYDYPAEPIVADLVSTGLACGSSLAEASYKGLMEVVERDAFMLTWHNCLPAAKIDLDRITDPLLRDLLARFKRVPAKLEAFLLNVDLPIPVVMTLMSGEQRPYHVVGAAADLSAARALQLALEEIALSFCGIRRLCSKNSEWSPAPDYSDVDDLNKHALVHGMSPALQGAVDFLRTGGTTELDPANAARGSWRDNLQQAVDLVAEAGYEALAVDLTTPDVDELGFKVVRAIVPGFQPLDVNHNHRHLGGRRLQQFRARSGRSHVNPLPHPFP